MHNGLRWIIQRTRTRARLNQHDVQPYGNNKVNDRHIKERAISGH